MRVLSLFDGMACGMIAFKVAGIPIDSYDAYEIDKFAVQVATHNFPEIREHGDVFKADFTEYEGVDYVIGGSPCTYWSIAQSPDKRETTASGIGWELFSQYVRAIKEAKPKYFIYENNKSMAKAIYDSISATFGFEPIMINSALVSAQNRERYYWVGKRNENGDYDKVMIEQPKDRGIMLKDILINPWGRDMCSIPISDVGGKSTTLTANTRHTMMHNIIANTFQKSTGVAIRVMNYELESVNDTDSGVQAMLDMPGSHDICRRVSGRNGKSRNITAGGGGNLEPKVFEKLRVREATKQGYAEISVGECVDLEQPNSKTRRGRKMQDKSNALTTQNEFYQYIGKTYEVKDGQIEVKGKKYPIKLSDGLYVVRKLSVDECKRLQTVPDWYDMNCISNSQAYKCLGNGWTIEVIAHLIRATQEGKTEAKQLTFWEV